jgi:soluble P-type ATPase
MFTCVVPEYGTITLHHFVSDFTGTLSVDGALLPGVREGLQKLAELVQPHVLTSDTFGSARQEVAGIDCTLHILSGGDNHAARKQEYIRTLGADGVIALGNGNNDRLMLETARVGVAVCLVEGCAIKALQAADILVSSPLDAFDLLFSPNRLKATLRR